MVFSSVSSWPGDEGLPLPSPSWAREPLLCDRGAPSCERAPLPALTSPWRPGPASSYCWDGCSKVWCLVLPHFLPFTLALHVCFDLQSFAKCLELKHRKQSFSSPSVSLRSGLDIFLKESHWGRE